MPTCSAHLKPFTAKQANGQMRTTYAFALNVNPVGPPFIACSRQFESNGFTMELRMRESVRHLGRLGTKRPRFRDCGGRSRAGLEPKPAIADAISSALSGW
jgi:hypothetical protein